MSEKYDLHCHSTFSDGDLTPDQLFALAAERNISHLALTDHDTLAGLQEAEAAASRHPVNLIPGIELSATWRGQLLHIVGLNVDADNAQLQAGVEHNQRLREQRAEQMVADFLAHGIDLGTEVKRIIGGASPTRPHFAQALINLGYAKNKQQAFKRYLVRGKPGFVPLIWPDLEQTANWIESTGGTAVLAHPLRYKMTRNKLVRLITEMRSVGICGIEVSTPVHDQQQQVMLSRLAHEHQLVASMGSDFHALDQPWARLGSAPPLADSLTPVWAGFH